MSSQNRNILIGAALAAGLVGAMKALLLPTTNRKGWIEKKQSLQRQSKSKNDKFNHNLFLGGIAGGLVGAAAALLLAPKAGIDLLKDISRPFIGKKEESLASTSHKKKQSHKAKPMQEKNQHKEEKKARRVSASKIPSRRKATSSTSSEGAEKGARIAAKEK